MTNRRVCVVTGTRAEYGLLYWVLRDLREAPDIDLQLLVTGTHLSPSFGMTVQEIERDGFAINERVEMMVASDTAGGVATSMALGLIGFSSALQRLQPDLVLVLGDRFETLAMAQACLVHRIPLAHIAGGDTTEGAFDESMRHAITKMAHVHLVTNELAARRVRQLGEDPAHIHVVGSPGLDHLRRRPLLDRAALEASLGAPLGAHNLLVTFHPATLDPGDGLAQFDELLAALEAQAPDTTIWITEPNADTGGRTLTERLRAWAQQHPDRVRAHASLGSLRYLSLMAQVDAVVGNSSSGLYEAPSFEVPTVNIGDRQRGRLAAASVLHCTPERGAIVGAIAQALALDCRGVVNPYGDGHSAPRIVACLRALASPQHLLQKHFHLIETTP